MRCPRRPRRWSALRNFFGYESRAAFAKDLLAHLNTVQGHYAKLFEGDDPTGSAKLPQVNYGAGPDDPRLLDHLATLGFKKPVVAAQRSSNGWQATTARCAWRRPGTPLSSSSPA